MESQMTEIKRSPSSINLLRNEFKKLKARGDRLENSNLKNAFYDQALQCLENAIEEQKNFDNDLTEDSKHYKLCFQKILFLEEIGRHEMACEYSQEIVEEYPDYSSMLYDVFNHYSDLNKNEIAKDYAESYIKLDEEK